MWSLQHNIGTFGCIGHWLLLISCSPDEPHCCSCVRVATVRMPNITRLNREECGYLRAESVRTTSRVRWKRDEYLDKLLKSLEARAETKGCQGMKSVIKMQLDVKLTTEMKWLESKSFKTFSWNMAMRHPKINLQQQFCFREYWFLRQNSNYKQCT